MKRNKIIAVAVVVLMMVGAVVLMSCSNCPGDGNCYVTASDFLGSASSWCFSWVTATEAEINNCFGAGAYSSTASSLDCQC